MRDLARPWSGAAPMPTFKLSRDPQFAAKVHDVVGLYVDPPAHSLVLSVDEKMPDAGARPHAAGLADEAGPRRDDDPRLYPQRHDHLVRRLQRARRHGDRRLHAAPSASGVSALSQPPRARHPGRTAQPRHPRQLRQPQHPKVRAWLARHPRWTFHFTPTSASWLNAVEGFFAKLTRRRLKRGVFHSLVDLQAAINRYLAEHNHSTKPFTWTADPDRIIAAASRGYQALNSIH